MKIVSLGQSPLMSKGLLSGFEQNGHETDMFEFQNWNTLSEPEQEEKFKSNLERTKPDLLVLAGYMPRRSTYLVDLCKEKGIGVMYWAIEDPVGFNETIELAKKCDYVFTTAIENIEDYKEHGIEAHLLLFACNPDFHYTGTHNEIYDIDIALVASAYQWEARKRGYEIILNSSLESGYSLKVWGAGWETDFGKQLLGDMSLFNGYLQNSQLRDLCATTKIVLGIQCDDSSKTQTSMRPFEVLGCGGFHLTQWTKATVNIFEDGKHLVTAKTKEDALEKMKFYINNESERKKIARQGQNFVYKNHTYKQRVGEIILPNM